MIESIGDTKSEAVNWVQDQYGLLRFIAEDLVNSSINNGKIIITQNGIFLTEEEEEFKDSVKNVAHRISQKYSRSHFRNHNKARKMANKMSSTNKGDDAAQDMIESTDDEDDNNALS